MKDTKSDTEADADFPPPPLLGSDRLIPLASWPAMFRERQVTGVEFEEFWFDMVQEGEAYFFSWRGTPRCTVLVTWVESEPTHIECRAIGDIPLSGVEAEPIIAEVTRLFLCESVLDAEPAH